MKIRTKKHFLSDTQKKSLERKLKVKQVDKIVLSSKVSFAQIWASPHFYCSITPIHQKRQFLQKVQGGFFNSNKFGWVRLVQVHFCTGSFQPPFKHSLIKINICELESRVHSSKFGLTSKNFSFVTKRLQAFFGCIVF